MQKSIIRCLNCCTFALGILIGVGIYPLIILGSICLANEKYNYLCGPTGRIGGITMVVIGCVLAVASNVALIYTCCTTSDACECCDDD